MTDRTAHHQDTAFQMPGGHTQHVDLDGYPHGRRQLRDHQHHDFDHDSGAGPATINPPHEEFTFGVVATNAGAPDGIALVDVRYHLSASGDTTVPTLTPGDIVSTYFLFPITPDGQSLGIGDGDAINGLKR